MKRFISLLLALLLVLTVPVAAFAAGEGSITINGISTDGTYEIYRLLDLESYDVASGAYSYKANAAWAAFFATAEAKAYMTTADDGYVTWTAAEDDETKANFAKLALAYAKANGITPVKSSKNAGEFVITESVGKFSDLELGYYLVDSTVGALCGLTTTNPNASINAKNAPPVIDKQVQEDSTTQWGASNTEDIGQTVKYRVTIYVHAGAQNYVLHDDMGNGLTYKQVTGIEHQGSTVDAAKYTVKTGADVTDGCDFEVHFSEAFCNELESGDTIVVSYEAMLNRDAVIAGDGNINTAWLTFGEGHKSNEDSVTTKTFSIDIVKTDSQNTLLDGAKFKIYDAAVDGNEIAVVPLLEDDESTPVLDGNGNPMYRRAKDDETGVEIVVKKGQVTVVGFDNGTYYLEETAAPDGYNKLSTRQKFIVSDANLSATFNDGIYSTGSGVHVVNKTGSMLPETGGLGTLMFILFGGGTALSTGVVLVTKKRMSKIEDED